MEDNLQIHRLTPPKPFIIEQHDNISWSTIDTVYEGEARESLNWWHRHHPKLRIQVRLRKTGYVVNPT